MSSDKTWSVLKWLDTLFTLCFSMLFVIIDRKCGMFPSLAIWATDLQNIMLQNFRKNLSMSDGAVYENAVSCMFSALRWRHNGRDSVSNHQPHDCLLNRLFRRRSKKTSKLRVTGLCVPGEFPAQKASNAENVSIWWHHYGQSAIKITNDGNLSYPDWYRLN